MPINIAFWGAGKQIEAFALLAEDMKERTDVSITVWTIGKENKHEAKKYNSIDDSIRFDKEIELDKEKKSEYQRDWLKKLEEKIGKNVIHKYVTSDRYICARRPNLSRFLYPDDWGYKKTYDFVAEILKRVERRVKATNLDGVYVESSSSISCLIRHICRLNDVTAFNIVRTRLWEGRVYLEKQNNYVWTDCRQAYNKYSDIPDPLKEKCISKASDINDNLSKNRYYERDRIGKINIDDLLSIDKILQYIKKRHKYRQEPWSKCFRSHSPSVFSISGLVYRLIRRKISEYCYKRAVTDAPVLDRQFAAYFLHVQPEATVDVMAYQYMDQITAIKNIVAGLPSSIPLYVKEHQPMIGNRPSNFYSELQQIPGVILINSTINQHYIIKNAQAVFTLTGTAGLESVIHGTPAVVLGEVFFNQFNGVYNPQGYKELKAVSSNVGSTMRAPTTHDGLRALAATYSASHKGAWPPNSACRKRDEKGVADLVIKCANKSHL